MFNKKIIIPVIVILILGVFFLLGLNYFGFKLPFFSTIRTFDLYEQDDCIRYSFGGQKFIVYIWADVQKAPNAPFAAKLISSESSSHEIEYFIAGDYLLETSGKIAVQSMKKINCSPEISDCDKQAENYFHMYMLNSLERYVALKTNNKLDFDSKKINCTDLK